MGKEKCLKHFLKYRKENGLRKKGREKGKLIGKGNEEDIIFNIYINYKRIFLFIFHYF